MNIFTEQKAFELASPSSYQKGKEYFDDGCVEKIWKENNTYKANVRGTHLYTVTFRIEENQFEAICTCPYNFEGICKHAVAAIFAFAQHREFQNITIQQRANNGDEEILKIVASATEGQLRTFLQKLLQKDIDLIKDFSIFLQGPKETPTTVKEYKEKIRHALDQLDMREVLQAWYAEEDDDYYDYHPEYAPETGPSLEEVTQPFLIEAETYLENDNVAECIKIYQAMFEALDEKQQTLHGEETELENWFAEEMQNALDGYAKSLETTQDTSIKTMGITYLCGLFEKQKEWQAQIGTVVKQVVVVSSEAESALATLSQSKHNTKLSIDESSLYAHLHFTHEDFELFENICLNHIKESPHLVVKLLRHYQTQGRKTDIISVAENFFSQSNTSSSSNEFIYPPQSYHIQDIEKEIRTILKQAYDPQKDYRNIVENLQRLFILTKSLSDYKEVAKVYKSKTEKEAFIDRLKELFSNQYDTMPLFKLLQYEKKGQDILDLIAKFPESDCFPQMIVSVQDEFPEECFLHYENKIKGLLKEANVKYYPQVAYHLKRMKNIGQVKKFDAFVSWIKGTYKQRRRLMAELNA
ncbi:MAG: hypothetical protein Q8P72_06315 [Candidatus Roizmanbacteria bacterium]|nr:hypothetical protein [Candidatus Roizmanbacteria bacterium]